ncbi:hypothetical protein ABTM63_20490, partial [Acinetobacter baumannii]
DASVSVVASQGDKGRGGAMQGFSEAARRAAPTVVSVFTNTSTAQNTHRNDPWFKYFYGEQGQQPQSGIGSGVIVSPEG